MTTHCEKDIDTLWSTRVKDGTSGKSHLLLTGHQVSTDSSPPIKGIKITKVTIENKTGPLMSFFKTVVIATKSSEEKGVRFNKVNIADLAENLNVNIFKLFFLSLIKDTHEFSKYVSNAVKEKQAREIYKLFNKDPNEAAASLRGLDSETAELVVANMSRYELANLQKYIASQEKLSQTHAGMAFLQAAEDKLKSK